MNRTAVIKSTWDAFGAVTTIVPKPFPNPLENIGPKPAKGAARTTYH